ncbi:MAG: hypothetical protein FJY65_03885 [Calditrichaeota bacterium]|nr:hypothetical protein [Calditrichota bacterium]
MMMMVTPNYGKADALVRRKPSVECDGRERPPCYGMLMMLMIVHHLEPRTSFVLTLHYFLFKLKCHHSN